MYACISGDSGAGGLKELAFLCSQGKLSFEVLSSFEW